MSHPGTWTEESDWEQPAWTCQQQILPNQADCILALGTSGEELSVVYVDSGKVFDIVSQGVLRVKLVIYELGKWKGLRKLAGSLGPVGCDQRYTV